MTTKEVKMILAYFRELYPNGKPGSENTVTVWCDLLKDYDIEIGLIASRNVARIWQGYTMPPPSVLIEEMDTLLGRSMSAIEYWRIAERAIKRGSVMTHEEFELLPEPVRRYFGGVSAVRDLGQLSIDQLPNERARFLKMIGSIDINVRSLIHTPEDLRNRIEQRNREIEEKQMQLIEERKKNDEE